MVIASSERSQQPGTPTLSERTNLVLLKIIRDNFPTQYASQAVSLAPFREAVLASGGIDVGATLANFRAHVPLSDYDSYQPFVDKFNVQPCKEEDVKDMFSPGLPDFFAISSATSGANPKIFPKYNRNPELNLAALLVYDPSSKAPIAATVYTGYRDVKVIEQASKEVVRRVPVCPIVAGLLRRFFGCYIDDESQLSRPVPGCAVPWAATVIEHFPSLLSIHGLFYLSRKDVDRFYTIFVTSFIDLIRLIAEQWDVFVSCIRDGTLPDLDGIEHVRGYLQIHFHADPERAAELLEIGPPFSSEGWFLRVWPNARQILTVCTGPFATLLPKARSIVGPNVAIRCPSYVSTETMIGVPYDANKLDEFVLRSPDVIEFLDISAKETHEHLCQAWEVEIGRCYEPVLTTGDGLWRYRLGDVVQIVGFHAVGQSPLFKFVGRRSLSLRLPYMETTDDQLVAAIRAFSSEDAVSVQEFTTVVDYRGSVPALGFFIELASPLGPNARLAPQTLFDAIVTTNVEHKHAFTEGQLALPTIRIVKAGTFAECRQWKGERANVNLGQIKVPVVLLDPVIEAWISERVVEEL